MEMHTPMEVKASVLHDLKQRRVSQIQIASMMGITRQTVSRIFQAKDEYFNEKNAALFSLAFGYNKGYLMSGEGSLLNYDSDYGLSQRAIYQGKLLEIYKKALGIASKENELVAKLGREKCMTLIGQAHIMYSFLQSFEMFPPLYINDVEVPPYDMGMIDAATRLFEPAYESASAEIQRLEKQ